MLSLYDKLDSRGISHQSKPFENLGNYYAQKDFFDRYFWPEIQLKICIHELGLQANNLLTALAVQLQEELLGEPSATAPSKKQLKKLNKKKKASSPAILDAVSDDTSASAEADVSKLTAQLQKELLDEPTVSKGEPSWKPLPLPPSDRETASISNIILPAAAVREPSKVAACAAPQLAISASSFEPASAALVNESTKGDPFQEAIASLKEPNILKFSDALKVFRDSFAATIKEGAIYTISLRGPNGLTNIYCHNSHGAQDVKRWPAWRINMKEGLRAAGYEW